MIVTRNQRKKILNCCLLSFILLLWPWLLIHQLEATTQSGGKSAADRAALEQQKTSRCPVLRVSSSKKLPSATLKQPYNKQLNSSGGMAPISYSIAKGSLPKGLKLTRTGLLTGVPTEAGSFRFTILVSDSCLQEKQIVKKTMNLKVKLPARAITVTTSPSHIDVTRGQSSSHQITYTFTAPANVSQSLNSNRGDFIAGTQVIGSINTSLRVDIRAGSGNVAETITISVGVIEQALQLGFSAFFYERVFYTSTGSIAATARVDISILGSDPLSVTTTPDSVTVPDDRDTEVGIVYTFSGESYVNTTLTSLEGEFYVSSNKIQSNAVPITATIQNGMGVAQESLVVVYTLIQQVLQLGAEQCEYRRVFTSPAGDISLLTVLTITIEISPEYELTVVPSSLRLPRDRESQRLIQYAINCNLHEDATFISGAGRFKAGETTLLELPLALTISVNNGYGSLSEPLVIPYDLTRRVAELGLVQFEYVREFIDDEGDEILHAEVSLYLTTGMGAELMIESIDLSFNNKRSETTIPRNYPDLIAFAHIAYSGTGLIEVKWFVDKRLISIMSTHLPAGGSVYLETPKIQPLPTFDTGTHEVTFEITKPPAVLPVPTIIYYVTTEESPPRAGTLEIISPQLNATFPFQSHAFKWLENESCPLYTIRFFIEGEDTEFFSAMTKDNHYTIPQSIFLEKFKRETNYLWNVMGYDEKNQICARSERFRFSFE